MDNIDSLNDYNATEKTEIRISLYTSDDEVTTIMTATMPMAVRSKASV